MCARISKSNGRYKIWDGVGHNCATINSAGNSEAIEVVGVTNTLVWCWRWWCRRELYITTTTTIIITIKAAAVSWSSKRSYYWWRWVREELPRVVANSGYDIERIPTMNKIDWANHFKFNFPIGIHFCSTITNSNYSHLHAHSYWRIQHTKKRTRANKSKLFILIPADE